MRSQDDILAEIDAETVSPFPNGGPRPEGKVTFEDAIKSAAAGEPISPFTEECMKEPDLDPPSTWKPEPLEQKIYTPEDQRQQRRWDFQIVTESSEPMSRAAVLALLGAGLKLEGAPLRIIGATVYEEFDEGDGRVLIEKED